MECVIAIDETHRNLLMLVTWLPSLAVAAALFTLLLRRRSDDPRSRLRATLIALGGGFGALFLTWAGLLWIGARLLC